MDRHRSKSAHFLLTLCVLVGASISLLALATGCSAVQISFPDGHQENYVSAYVTFGRDDKSNLPAANPPQSILLKASGGCHLSQTVHGLLNSSNPGSFIGVSHFSDVVGAGLCVSYADFVRTLQTYPAISGAVVINLYYRDPGSYRTNPFWQIFEDTTDITLPVDEISRAVSDCWSSQGLLLDDDGSVSNVTIIISNERGPYHDLFYTGASYPGFQYTAVIIWLVLFICSVYCFYLFFRSKRSFVLNVKVILCVLFVVSEKIFDNLLGQPLYPSVAFNISDVLLFVSFMIGILAYGLVILQWIKAVFLLNTFKSMESYERPFTIFLLALAVVIGVLEAVAVALSNDVINLCVVGVIAICVLIESIGMVYFGLQVLSYMIKRSSDLINSSGHTESNQARNSSVARPASIGGDYELEEVVGATTTGTATATAGAAAAAALIKPIHTGIRLKGDKKGLDVTMSTESLEPLYASASPSSEDGDDRYQSNSSLVQSPTTPASEMTNSSMSSLLFSSTDSSHTSVCSSSSSLSPDPTSITNKTTHEGSAPSSSSASGLGPVRTSHPSILRFDASPEPLPSSARPLSSVQFSPSLAPSHEKATKDTTTAANSRDKQSKDAIARIRRRYRSLKKNWKLTGLIMTSGIAFFGAFIVAFLLGIWGSTPSTYESAWTYFYFVISREITMLVLVITIVAYLFLSHVENQKRESAISLSRPSPDANNKNNLNNNLNRKSLTPASGQLPQAARSKQRLSIDADLGIPQLSELDPESTDV